MTKMLIDRAVVEQALEALEYDNPAGRTATITALRAALAQDQLHDQQLRDDAERWRNIRGYVEAMEDEICALRSSLRAALAREQAEPRHPPIINDRFSIDPTTGNLGIGTPEFAEPVQEPVQEPDSPERRCGGPGCDMTCCQPVQEPVLQALADADRVMGHDDEATEWRERWKHLFGVAGSATSPWRESAAQGCSPGGTGMPAAPPQRPAEPVGIVSSLVKGGVVWQRWPADMPDGTRLFSEVQP